MPTTNQEKLDGYVSVTEVLDYFQVPELVAWKLRVGAVEAKKISTIAMKIGSRVDALIQEDVANGSYKLTAKDPIEVQNCMKAWEAFKNDYSPKISITQQVLKDYDLGVIGHLDLLTDRIVDVKCASSIKPSYWIQTAKYSDMHSKGVLGTAILRLDKNLGVYQYLTNEQAGYSVKDCIAVFDGLIKAYRFYNRPKGSEE